MPLCCTMKPGFEPEVKEQVDAVETDRCGTGEGLAIGPVGESGRVTVKNTWTLWCCSMCEGRVLRHLGSIF